MSEQFSVWLDGTLTTSLPLPDRGIDFGDGLFETILLRNGCPLYLEYHLDRLASGMRALQLPECLDKVRSQLYVAASVARQYGQWAVLRLSVLRATGVRGYAPTTNPAAKILIYANSLQRDCSKLDRPAVLRIVELKLSEQPFLARIKHLNRLEQIIAAAQIQREGFDEGIMLNRSDEIVSVIAGNLFLVYEGKLLTPPILDCGVAGTRRRLIIEKWAPAVGLDVREQRLTKFDLDHADELFYSNSLQTVRPIARVGNRRWDQSEVCSKIFKCYLDELPA